MQKSLVSICFVNLSACLSTTSWGKVLQSLITYCRQNDCLSLSGTSHLLISHYAPGPFLGKDNVFIVPNLVSLSHLWFMDLCHIPTQSFHFCPFCLVIPSWEAVPHLWSSLWPFPELCPDQIYPFWGQRNRTLCSIQGAGTWKAYAVAQYNLFLSFLKNPHCPIFLTDSFLIARLYLC